MPLTHDIGVRIPYPLLKTDNFGCLFFLHFTLWYAELTITSSVCFRLIIILSKLNDINLKTSSLRLLLCISYNTNYSVVISALRTGEGLSRYCNDLLLDLRSALFLYGIGSTAKAVRIPYPLLKTDNFGCLFFLHFTLWYAELTITSPHAFRLYVLASKLAYNSLKP